MTISSKRKNEFQDGLIVPLSFRGRLLRWYTAHKRDLPWRRTKNPYAVWVSEIMLQQTTINAVIPYYEEWLRKYPDIQSLARAPLQIILKSWEGLGYYQRARNMRWTAQEIVKNHGGRFPEDDQTLRALPGFGPYTTAAVMSLSFGRPYPVVDANVRRVMMRILGIKGSSDSKHDAVIGGVLETLISRRSPGNFNQAMMELGAIVCRPHTPRCLQCPLQLHCRAFERGEQEIIPTPKIFRAKKIEAVVAVIRDGEKILIQQRPPEGLLAGLWEFPGGKVKGRAFGPPLARGLKPRASTAEIPPGFAGARVAVEPGESLRSALARELREELGVEVETARPLLTVKHAYTQFEVTLHAFEVTLRGGPAAVAATPSTKKTSAINRGRKSDVSQRLLLRRWVPLKSLNRFPFPSGSLKIIRHITKLKS